MAQGSVATILGLLGGLFMLLGVLVGVIFGGFYSAFTQSSQLFFHLGYVGTIDVVLGFLVLVFTGYARSHPPPDKAVGGVVVLVVAIIAFVFTNSGWFLLVTIGAILAFLAGLVFLLESAFQRPPTYAPRS